MGADLYIKSLTDRSRRTYKPKFETACKLRSLAQSGSPEEKMAQELVDKYYCLMYGKGYFRDSYNCWCLLWVLDLSWWADIKKLLDKNGYMSVTGATALRYYVIGKDLPKPREIKASGNGWEKATAKQIKDALKYWEEDREAFVDFLTLAIDRNEPIYCSI